MPIIYWRDGTQNSVPDGDVPYWLSQGWSTSKPGTAPTSAPVTSASAQPQPSVQPVQAASPSASEVITIYGPNGVQGRILASVADEWLKNSPGWSKTPPTAASPATAPVKQILSDGAKLYASDGVNQPVPINTQAELEKYVIQQGYKDTRASLASVGASGVQSPAQGTVGPTEAVPVDAADKAWIDQLYQKYFDRGATSKELANWAKETPQALDQFLAKEAKTYGYTSAYFKNEDNVRLEAALKVIDDSGLPPDVKELLKTATRAYPKGVEYDTDEIIRAFEKVKASTIDPYFKQMADLAVNDVKTARAQEEERRAMELETEGMQARQNVEAAQKGLEASGMTFSGKAAEQLGAKSAYQTSDIAAPLPFGGAMPEGTVNAVNRLSASSTAARNRAAMQAIGIQAEKTLGSAGAQAAGFAPQVGGIEGTQATEKQGKYASSLQSIIDQYKSKQTAMTNKLY